MAAARAAVVLGSRILDVMQRLNWVQNWGFPRELADGIAGKWIDQVAARGARHSLAHFRRFFPEKRYAILAAFLLNLAEELTDRSMDFYRHLFRESEKKQWIGFVQQGPSVNEKLHNYARLTAVIAGAHQDGRSLEAAIEQEFAWEALELVGQAAGRLTRPPLQDFRAQSRSSASTRRNSWRPFSSKRSPPNSRC
jgi:hypothetical protein